MRTASPHLKRVIGALLIFGSAAIAVVSFVPIQFPWNRSAHLVIESTPFGVMNPGAGVELAGIRVGEVEQIEYKGSSSRIHAAIQPQYVNQLHSDATATIEPHGLLGPKFVQLASGSKGSIHDGSVIPLSRSHVTTDFDQVLNALQPDVRNNLQVIFVELGNASQGRGDDMNSALQHLGNSSANLDKVTAILKERDADTKLFFDSSEQLNSEVQKAPISQNIADTNRTLAALVQVEDSITASIDETAAVLQQLDIAMAGNEGNLALVLSRAPVTASRLTNYIGTTDTVINGIRPSLPNLLTAVVEGESVTGGKDANGHYVRVLALSGQCTAAADPANSCHDPAPVPPGSAAGPAAPGSAPSPAPTTEPAPKRAAGISDQALVELLLGG
ncbi:MAG: MCE family protein [Chloroflexi bacterium]|nr:MAG: MCE family protein [Chloroflexota bacterium]